MAAARRLREVRRRHDARQASRATLTTSPKHLRERAFQLRPVWQRFLVVLAGPMANFVLAIVIFAAFFSLVAAPANERRRRCTAQFAGSRGRHSARVTGSCRLLGGRPATSASSATSPPSGRTRRRSRVQRGEFVRQVRVRLGERINSTAANGRNDSRGLFGIASTRVCARADIQSGPEASADRPRMTRARSSTRIVQMVRGYARPRRRRPDRDRECCRAVSPDRSGRVHRPASHCSQLISDSSTCCQSRCWMADICFSMSLRQSGGVRSAMLRLTGRSGAGSQLSLPCWFSRRATISACGTSFNA